MKLQRGRPTANAWRGPQAQTTRESSSRDAPMGAGDPKELWHGQRHVHVLQYTPDGRSILFETESPNAGIWLLPLDGSAPSGRALIDTPANEALARVSPNGQWIAYVSDVTGADQIYVEPFPGRGPRIPVGPGTEPVWARDDRRLYYRASAASSGLSMSRQETLSILALPSVCLTICSPPRETATPGTTSPKTGASSSWETRSPASDRLVEHDPELAHPSREAVPDALTWFPKGSRRPVPLLQPKAFCLSSTTEIARQARTQDEMSIDPADPLALQTPIPHERGNLAIRNEGGPPYPLIGCEEVASSAPIANQ